MKISFVLLLTLFAQILFAQNRFEIKGRSPSSLNGNRIYLTIFDYYSDGRFTHRDSAIIKNGSFTFSGSIPKVAEMATISSDSVHVPLIIEAGLNQLTINPTKDRAKHFYSGIVEKSINNAIYGRLDSLSGAYYKSFGQPIPDSKSGRFLSKSKQQELCIKQLDVLRQHPESIVSLLGTYEIASMASMQDRLEVALDTYGSLSDELRQSPLGQEFYKKISTRLNEYNASKVGSKVQEFTVSTNEGKSFNNKQLSGHPYLIAFSATWCKPCQEELPQLKEIYDRYKKKGLQVVYFNLDDNVGKWNDHIRKNNLSWINVSERTKAISSDIAKRFHIYALPTTILVDRRGIIVYNSDFGKGGVASLAAKVEKLL